MCRCVSEFADTIAVCIRARLLAGSAGIPARMSAKREDCVTLQFKDEIKSETLSVLAHACGQGCPRSQL